MQKKELENFIQTNSHRKQDERETELNPHLHKTTQTSFIRKI